MELWIRSQDKMRLVKVNSINILDNGLTFHGYINDKDHFWLANYKTKERALEVLDEIQNILKPQVITKLGKIVGKTCDGTIYTTPNETEIKELSTYVYKMPEE